MMALAVVVVVAGSTCRSAKALAPAAWAVMRTVTAAVTGWVTMVNAPLGAPDGTRIDGGTSTASPSGATVTVVVPSVPVNVTVPTTVPPPDTLATDSDTPATGRGAAVTALRTAAGAAACPPSCSAPSHPAATSAASANIPAIP